MGKLSCNIVTYRPDPEMLAANFRHWHVESLLHQAANLVDRCRGDFDQYCSLHYDWNRFRNELETQEMQLVLKRGAEPEPVPKTEAIESPGAAGSPDEGEETAEGGEGEAAEVEEAPAAVEEAPLRNAVDLLAEAVQRKRELSAPGGPFALDERRDLALKRLCRDYEEAVNRACVAEEGLKTFYDYLPPSSPLPAETEALGDSITNLANWIRDATEWLVEYHQMEEIFTRAVSVRSLITRNAWVQVKQSRDSFATGLRIPDMLFREHHNCRLLGVSASLIGEVGKVPWSITLKLPEQGIYQRWGQTVEVDQTRRPTCLLGRVENRKASRQPELCGASSWVNASPMGKPNEGWSFEIVRPGATSESFSHLEDVVLEIRVAGIPVKIKS